MNDLDLIHYNITIRNTIGFKLMDKVPLTDIPEVYKFAKIIENYTKLCYLTEGKKYIFNKKQ